MPSVAVQRKESPIAAEPALPRADEVALFIDLDGTLIEFAATPDAVVVDAQVPLLLDALRRATGGALAVLSGRPLAAIDALLDLPQIAAAGQHGAEMRMTDGQVRYAPIDPAPIAAARALVFARNVPGVRIEDKGVALAFHYREVPRAEPLARELAAAALHCAGTGFELQHGDCVIELKSSRVDKGRALAALMTQAPFAGRTPWVLGDDFTDEHAFAMAQSLDGVGVIVGTRRPSVAHHALEDVASARAWLAQLAAQRAFGGAFA